MPEPLPKLRRTSLSKTTRIANNPHNSTATPWTTARCHRLLRPLAAKLQALRSILQSNPSAINAGAIRQKPKHDPTDPDALFVQIVEETEEEKVKSGTRVRSKPRRTYSGVGRGGAARGGAAITTSSVGANDSYLSIWGGFSSAETAGVDSDVNPPKKSRRPSSPDPNSPLTLLHSLKSTIHPSIFSAYLGIYSALESVLLSTNLPSTTHVLPLRVLAARRIAHCILATSSEVDSDDIWYDAVADLGSGGEYLRELVRWHAIELVREATTEGFMGRSDSGLGIRGVLILLCKTVGAEQEAQSLLQTLFDLHPVVSSPQNPALLALKTFFSSEPEVQYRFLTKNFPSTCSNPSWLGSPDIHKFLLLAAAEIDYKPGIEALASRALEATFGLWGESHILALAAQRREAAKRKAPPRGTKHEGEPARRKTQSVMPYKIGARSETVILKMIESLILLSFQDPSSKARGVLQGLVRGFLSQTHDIRIDTEEVWGSRWPVAGKVAVLLQGLGYGDDVRIVEEISRCLEDVCGNGGKEGMRSLASFIAQCYLPLYDRYSSRDEVQLLASRLLSLAAQSGQSEVLLPPETPRMLGRGIVTFTPGKPDLAPDQEVRETKRYLVSQLALQIAVSFSLADSVKRDATWIKWLGKFEHKVIGLKIQTPGRVKAVLENPGEEEKRKEGGKKRKGWRYEEGLDLWVAVGATPGREGREKKKGVFMACVQVEMGDGDWKDEYESFDDELDVTVSDAESNGSEYTRPVTPISTSTSTTTSDDDDDDEFYSNIRTTPPRTLRRSPRGTARIRRSLVSFAVNLSSPVFAMRTPARESVTARGRFDLSVGGSSPSSANGMGWWEDGGHSSPVLRRGRGWVDDGDGDEESGGNEGEEAVEEEEEEEYMEGETEGDISTLGLGGVKLDNGFTSPRVSQLSSLGSKRKREAARSLDNLMDTSEEEEEEEEEEEDGSEYQDEPPEDIDMELMGVTRDEEKEEEEEEEEEEIEEAEEMEETDDDLFTIAVNTALPSSSPPPPTPPPPPRRPKRMSLAGIKSMLNTNLSRTPSSEPTPTRDPTPTPPKKAAELPIPQAAAFTPHRKIVDDPRLQRKIDKSARRRRRARERKRMRVAEMAKRLDEVSDDELGV